MSLAIGIVAHDGAVIVTDRRSTIGDQITSEDCKKQLRLDTNTVIVSLGYAQTTEMVFRACAEMWRESDGRLEPVSRTLKAMHDQRPLPGSDASQPAAFIVAAQPDGFYAARTGFGEEWTEWKMVPGAGVLTLVLTTSAAGEWVNEALNAALTNRLSIEKFCDDIFALFQGASERDASIGPIPELTILQPLTPGRRQAHHGLITEQVRKS